MPAGGTCAGRPCWKDAGQRGLRYGDRDTTPNGIVSAALKPGEDGRASIRVKAKGANVPMPPLPLAQGPTVTVQLQSSDGTCWEAAYDAPAARNDGEGFKDKSD
jgi:hypothetical protein